MEHQRTETEHYDGSLEVRTLLNFVITPHDAHLLNPISSSCSQIYYSIDLDEHLLSGLKNAFDGRSPSLQGILLS